MEKYQSIEPDYNLLAKHFANETNAEESRLVDAWVSANSMHKKSYDRMYFLWLQTSKHKIDARINVDKAWQKMQTRMHDSDSSNDESDKTISIYRRTIYRFLQLAAIIIVGLAVHHFLYVDNAKTDNYISFVSEINGKSIILPDESLIKLSKKSKLIYPETFKGNQRLVKLEGEAFFDVKPNKRKPFIIEAQFAKIKVLGTSFNVKALNDQEIVEVEVKSGTVELSSITLPGEILIINAGEKAVIEKSKKQAQKVKGNSINYTKKIIFKDTKLIEVAATLKQAYGVDIKFENEDIKQCVFSLVIYNMNVDSVMQKLQQTHNELIITKESNNKFVISGKKCPEDNKDSSKK